MSADSTVAITAAAVMNDELSPYAATFVPASQPESDQTQLSPYATDFVSESTTPETPLSPHAPNFVPHIKDAGSPLSPTAAIYIPKTTPAESLRTSWWLLALMQQCQRRIHKKLEALELLEQQPTYLRCKHGDHLVESMEAYDDYDMSHDKIETTLKNLIVFYARLKAQLEAGLWEDEAEEDQEERKVEEELEQPDSPLSIYSITFPR